MCIPLNTISNFDNFKTESTANIRLTKKKNKSFSTIIDYQNEETTSKIYNIHTIIYKNILKTVGINDNFFMYEIE